jgi:hypothetical protein
MQAPRVLHLGLSQSRELQASEALIYFRLAAASDGTPRNTTPGPASACPNQPRDRGAESCNGT